MKKGTGVELDPADALRRAAARLHKFKPAQRHPAPLVGPMRVNVRDHIESQQNDHGPLLRIRATGFARITTAGIAHEWRPESRP
jgi:hypothetical protein